MVRFAHESLSRSLQVFSCLEATLGKGTNLLNMRVGLHSGPVTAGVLRGQKGRFQVCEIICSTVPGANLGLLIVSSGLTFTILFPYFIRSCLVIPSTHLLEWKAIPAPERFTAVRVPQTLFQRQENLTG